MTFVTLSSAALAATEFHEIEDLPPYAELIPGSVSQIALFAGPAADRGAVASFKIASGGFKYTNIEAAESGFLVEGSAVVTDTDGETVLRAGDGYYFPVGWSGTFVAREPVTKFAYLL